MPAPIPALADTASLRIFDIGKKMKLECVLGDIFVVYVY